MGKAYYFSFLVCQNGFPRELPGPLQWCQVGEVPGSLEIWIAPGRVRQPPRLSLAFEVDGGQRGDREERRENTERLPAARKAATVSIRHTGILRLLRAVRRAEPGFPAEDAWKAGGVRCSGEPR